MKQLLLIFLLTILSSSPVHAASGTNGTQSERAVVVSPGSGASAPAVSEARVALVIGNSAYKVSQLKNPVNDARAVASALKGLGFDVMLMEDCGLEPMKEAVERFGDRLIKGGVGLFYYSGHGMQVRGENYLVPVDADIKGEAEVAYKTLNAGLVLAKMADARNRMNIVILDACRNNPFARGFRSANPGLASMNAPVGTIVAYSTAPGSVASDGSGNNGLYTGELVREMKAPGVKIEDVFKHVRSGVKEKSDGEQIPWESSSLEGDFYFKGGEALSPSPSPTGGEGGVKAESEKAVKADKQKNLDELKARLDSERAKLEEQENQLERPRLAKLVVPVSSSVTRDSLKLFSEVFTLVENNYVTEPDRKKLILNAMEGMSSYYGQENSVSLSTYQDLLRDSNDRTDELDVFSNAFGSLLTGGSSKKDAGKLVNTAIKAMLGGLDPHSGFMTPDMYKEMQVDTKGVFGGVGIQLGIKDKKLVVIAPIEDTPAFDAGVLAGDHIVEIDGAATEDMTLTEAVNKMRGPKGSQVTITIMRDGSDRTRDFTLTRDIVRIKSVKYDIMDGDIGYVKISQFQENTASDLDKALREFDREHVKSIILDLRNDPGGLLNMAVEVSGSFLPKDKLVVYIKNRNGEKDKFFTSNSKPRTKLPMVVLVNEGSASASEIVTGCLQDWGRAVVIGTQTFGKGSVQTVYPLTDGSGLRLTTARYYTPKDRTIQNTGITPDIEVNRGNPGSAADNDLQLDEAVEYLSNP